jgi:nucleotide-binding universal stress UspA family protein
MLTNILVLLDGSELAERALPYAAELARLYGARLTLARVPETMVVPVASAGIWITRETEPHEARTHAEEYLAEVAGRPLLEGLTVASTLPHHPVVHGLLEAMAATGPDLVVLTTHGRTGVTRLLLGSVASKIIQHAPVPALVVPAHAEPTERPAFQTLIVPLDGSANSELALPTAMDLARRSGGRLRLMRVPTVPSYLTVLPDTAAMIPSHLQQKALEAEGYLAQQASALADAGIDVAADVEIALEGGVEQAIADYAETHGADAILLCSHGQSGIKRLIMGSIADRVLRLAHSPVWIVRPGDEEAA